MLVDPVGVPPRWGLSSVDARAHTIDEDADHPAGVYVGRCEQRLLRATNLYDEPPDSDWICLSCLCWTNPKPPPRGTP